MEALDRYEELIVDYTKVIALNPDDANAYFDRGLCQATLGKHKEAIAEFSKAIEKGDTELQVVSYYNRGNAKRELGKHEEAIADYTEAIQKGDKELQADAYYNRGVSKWEQGKYEEAINDYAKAKVINPDFEKALSNREKGK